jgi:hypothetical protein
MGVPPGLPGDMGGGGGSVAPPLPAAIPAVGTASDANVSKPVTPTTSHARIRRLCACKPVSFVGLRG